MSSEGTLSPPLPDDYIEMTRQQRQNLVQELDGITSKIVEIERSQVRLSELRDKRKLLESQILAMDTILGEQLSDPPIPDELPEAVDAAPMPQSMGLYQQDVFGELPQASIGSRRDRSQSLSESVDAVVKVLSQETPLHYREIYDRVTAMGVTIVGKDPAATLLARFGRDDRVRRVGSGTYELAQPNDKGN